MQRVYHQVFEWAAKSFDSNEGYELGKDIFSLSLEPVDEVEDGDD